MPAEILSFNHDNDVLAALDQLTAQMLANTQLLLDLQVTHPSEVRVLEGRIKGCVANLLKAMHRMPVQAAVLSGLSSTRGRMM